MVMCQVALLQLTDKMATKSQPSKENSTNQSTESKSDIKPLDKYMFTFFLCSKTNFGIIDCNFLTFIENNLSKLLFLCLFSHTQMQS
jgi:hypothetical protein